MSVDDQQDSDPLPYTQVDRAVKPKAVLLAGMMGTTPQHALGSLVEFWDLNGDPREIERLFNEGKREVVLDRETVAERFELASGHAIDPGRLARLGLLEQRGPNEFRVRGMSRYFAPIEGRIEARRKASAGGKASVEARRKRFGTAQPRSGAGSEPASGQVRSGFEPPFEPPFEPVFEPAPKQSPNPPEHSGQRSADISISLSQGAPPQKAPTPRVINTPGDAFWSWSNDLRLASGHVGEDPPRNLGSWFSAAMMRLQGDEARLRQAFERYLGSDWWRARGCPFERFQAKWPEFASEHYGKETKADDKPQRDRPEVYANGPVKLKLGGGGQ